MRATISAGLATVTLGALGALAGASSLGCENTASDCAKLGTVCTGGGGAGGGGAGGGGAGGGGAGGGGAGGGGAGGGGMGGGTTSSTSSSSTTTSEPCAVVKVKSFGDAADQSARSLLVTPASDVVVAGTFFGDLQFGMTELTAPGPDPSFFVARSGADLAPNFARRFDAAYKAGALDANGAFVAVGIQSAAVDFGCGSVDLDPAFDVGLFVVKVDSLGVCVFHRVFGATAVPTVDVAVGPSGEIALVGGFEGSLAVDDAAGALPFTSAGGTDIFVAKLADTGAHVWSEAYGDAGEDQATAVVIHSDAKIVVAGDHTGELDFENGDPPTNSGTQTAPFLVAFNGNGTVPWARSFQVATGSQRAFGLALDTSVEGAPAIVLSGDLEGVVESAKVLPTVAGDAAVGLKDANHGVFLARFALDNTGKLLSSGAFAGAGKLAVHGTSVDSAGRILLAGWLDQSLTFAAGAGELTSGGVPRAFMAVLGKDLTHQKSATFGGAGESRAFGAAFEGGDALVAGSYSGTLEVQGSAVVTSKGGDDLFVARLCAE